MDRRQEDGLASMAGTRYVAAQDRERRTRQQAEKLCHSRGMQMPQPMFAGETTLLPSPVTQEILHAGGELYRATGELENSLVDLEKAVLELFARLEPILMIVTEQRGIDPREKKMDFLSPMAQRIQGSEHHVDRIYDLVESMASRLPV